MRAVRNRLLPKVVGQFHRPHGLGGQVAGSVMAHRSSNLRRNRWVVSLLDVQPTDRVLEIGCGPGVAIRELARFATDGLVYGIDHSEVMVKMATKRNAAAVRSGQVQIMNCSVENLPPLGEPLDSIVAINSMGLWPDPPRRLEELRERLRPGGQIAIASQPRCPGATAETSERAGRGIEAALRTAGFGLTQMETLPLKPPVVCVIARNSERGSALTDTEAAS